MSFFVREIRWIAADQALAPKFLKKSWRGINESIFLIFMNFATLIGDLMNFLMSTLISGAFLALQGNAAAQSVPVLYRNMADTTTFNRTSGSGATAGVDIYDTIDDYNNASGEFPTENPAGWTQATGENWVGNPAGGSYLDTNSGLSWTVDSGRTFNWQTAITFCENLSSGGFIDWRLPTQKDLLQAYVDGISAVNSALRLNSGQFWSATTKSVSTSEAWNVRLRDGQTVSDSKSSYFRVVCVR
jgi:hypothetical protein